MSLKENVREDILVNKNNGKGKFIAIFYRISNYIISSNNLFVKFSGYFLLKFYRLLVINLMGVEIHERTKIGKGLQIWHGTALVINPEVTIGNNVLLRHSTTIGNKFAGSKCPVIGDNVEIGAHSILIGDITIGDNVTIGAGSIITKSIPPNSLVYGNPLVIKSKV